MSNTLLYCLYPCDFLSVNGSISGWCLIDENTKLNLWPVFRWWRSALKLYYMSKKRCPELWGKTTLHWNCSNSEKNWLSIWRLMINLNEKHWKEGYWFEQMIFTHTSRTLTHLSMSIHFVSVCVNKTKILNAYKFQWLLSWFILIRNVIGNYINIVTIGFSSQKVEIILYDRNQ